MSSSLAALVADARKTLPAPSKDAAAVDAWVDQISAGQEGQDLQALDKKVEPVVYLFNNELSVADVATFGALHPVFVSKTKEEYYTTPSLTRYINHLQSLPELKPTLSAYAPIEFNLADMPKVERKSVVAKEKKPKKAAEGAAAAVEPKVAEAKQEAKGLVAGVTEQLSNLTVAAGAAASSLASSAVAGAQQAAAAVGLTEGAPAAAAADQKTQKKEKKEKAPKAPKPAAEPAAAPNPSMIDLRVGHILAVEKHPDADSLYIETIDVGEAEPRTVISGLVNYLTPEQVLGARVVVVANMKPVAMRGVKSYAMLLCATSAEGKDGGLEFVQPPAASAPGERIYFESPKFENATPLEQMNPKKKIFETVQPGFTTLPSLEAAWVDKETGEVAKIRTKDGYCVVKTFVGASLS